MDQAWVPSLDSVGQRHLSTKELTICSVVGWGLADSPTGCATRGPPHDMLSLQAQVCSCPHCATFRLQGPSLGLETGLSRTCWIVPPPHSCLEWKETGQGGGLLPGWMRVEDKGWHEALPEWRGIGEQRPEGWAAGRGVGSQLGAAIGIP